MAKKKLVVEEVEPEVSQAVEPVEVAVKADPLLTVTTAYDFKDGALASRFAEYGYPVFWKKGETRSIPRNLLIRCKQSGARFEV